MTILQNEKREDDQNVLPMAITNGSPWAGTTASTGHALRTTAQAIPLEISLWQTHSNVPQSALWGPRGPKKINLARVKAVLVLREFLRFVP